MPATVTPIQTEPHKQRRPDDHDHGSGRRPPNDKNDKRTGGGGDGDKDNWSSRSRGGPRQKLTTYRHGLFFALGAVVMFFAAIVGAFFVTQASGRINAYNNFVNDWLPTTIPPILWLNTAVLLLSSISIEIARRSMFREVDVMDEWLGIGKPITRAAYPWLTATLVLGLMFLTGQWVAWHQLAIQHISLGSNPSSHFFFLITYAHAFHLLLGVAALVTALVGLFASHLLETRQILVDCTAWYWHSMGVLWIFLFALLVFFQ
jgi:cytochrome c oxidase subunit 3